MPLQASDGCTMTNMRDFALRHSLMLRRRGFINWLMPPCIRLYKVTRPTPRVCVHEEMYARRPLAHCAPGKLFMLHLARSAVHLICDPKPDFTQRLLAYGDSDLCKIILTACSRQ